MTFSVQPGEMTISVSGYCWFYGLIAAVRWRMKNIRPPGGGFDPLRFIFAIAAALILLLLLPRVILWVIIAMWVIYFLGVAGLVYKSDEEVTAKIVFIRGMKPVMRFFGKMKKGYEHIEAIVEAREVKKRDDHFSSHLSDTIFFLFFTLTFTNLVLLPGARYMDWIQASQLTYKQFCAGQGSGTFVDVGQYQEPLLVQLCKEHGEELTDSWMDFAVAANEAAHVEMFETLGIMSFILLGWSVLFLIHFRKKVQETERLFVDELVENDKGLQALQEGIYEALHDGQDVCDTQFTENMKGFMDALDLTKDIGAGERFASTLRTDTAVVLLSLISALVIPLTRLAIGKPMFAKHFRHPQFYTMLIIFTVNFVFLREVSKTWRGYYVLERLMRRFQVDTKFGAAGQQPAEKTEGWQLGDPETGHEELTDWVNTRRMLIFRGSTLGTVTRLLLSLFGLILALFFVAVLIEAFQGKGLATESAVTTQLLRKNFKNPFRG
jgi:hypothetical protein